MVAAVSSSTLSNATSAAGQTSAQEQSDRFMKLLVAQLNNQDPLNPMDNAEMTSQMAQINTVSGIQTLNESVKSLSDQFTSMQLLQATSMIGREVLTPGNAVSVHSGVGKGALSLPANADKVTVQVRSPSGQLLDTIELGAKATGRHSFEWNASGYTGSGAPTFSVSASNGGKAVSATTLRRDTITGVDNAANGVSLALRSGGTAPHSSIQAIL
ncbi:flagellar hook assembly protein FlgD [Rhodoferax sp.]|jgi:flagellar basal-body rod modification protein FlgD|uniref:flagellar hook assembly protein FlgD n=1 Tax=Rhodoferax sp. TaxID=50421 RepID=UPI003785318D